MFKVANVGSTDRIVRIVVGLLLVALPFIMSLGSPAAKWASIVVGVVLVVTALVRFCPLYRIIGASTCSAPKQ